MEKWVKKLEYEMNFDWTMTVEKYKKDYLMSDAQDVNAHELMEMAKEFNEEFEEQTLPYLKTSIQQLSNKISNIKNNRVTVLDFAELIGKFALLNVAVCECVWNLIKGFDEPWTPKAQQRFRTYVLHEATQFVEECPTPETWYDVMKLPLEAVKDPDFIFDDVRV